MASASGPFRDHLGSTAVTADASGAKTGELRYYPYGSTRSTWGTTPTTYRFTGQREERTIGLYFYNARWYDPVLGRFVQPDTLVPEPGNPQALNRYAYVYNNPLRYIDADGHLPIIPILIVGGIIVLKAVDYGWTAWDSYQSLKVINDPNASEADKAAATANLAMTAAFEAAEPDDLLPVALPLDDLARKGVIALGKEASQETAEQGFKRFTERNFRENLMRLTHKSADEVKGLEAHHVFPQEFIKRFKEVGIDIHDPKFGSWVEAPAHRRWSTDYNEKWRKFLATRPTRDEMLRFARQLAEEYGFDVYFDAP